MNRPWIYGAAYLLWAVTLGASLLVGAAVRDVYQFALNRTPWHRYSIHAVDQFGTFFLALLLVFAVIFVEHYYRTGVQKGLLWARFSRLAAILLAILSLLQALRVWLEWQVGLTDVTTVYILVGALAGTAAFAWLSRLLRRQSV